MVVGADDAGAEDAGAEDAGADDAGADDAGADDAGGAVGALVGTVAGSAGPGEPITVTVPSALRRRKAGDPAGINPIALALAPNTLGACRSATSRDSCCS
jgi:hypothetical protein